MDNGTNHFKNTMTSSFHASFQMRYFFLENPFIFFLRTENGLKTDKICKTFLHMNICLHNHIFIYLHIAYEHIYLTPGTSYSVMNARVAAHVLGIHNC